MTGQARKPLVSARAEVAARLPNDLALRDRAQRVIPGGMYGHQSAGELPEGYPQFMARGEGCRVWDVDGNEYIDLMCSYGPIILGHRDPRVEEAAQVQRATADCQNGPGAIMVELAELLVDTVSHADWAIFAKNGTDATTTCLTIARAATRRQKVMLATGAYHGAAPWCTPRHVGTTAADHTNLIHFDYNDLESVEAAEREAGDDLAAVIVCPIRHDAGIDQEDATPEFAAALRALCDRQRAALVLDDVRCGLRLRHGGSWELLGVEPDLSAWSKGIANGYPLAAVLGADWLRDAAASIYVTGSFWFASVAMAAAVATIDTLGKDDAVAAMTRAGQHLRDGLDEQARAHGLSIRQTGPVQMPYISFDGDIRHEIANLFSDMCVRKGAYVHPTHNWFICASHSERDIDQALEATDAGMAAVATYLR